MDTTTLTYAVGIANAARKLGIETQIFAHRKIGDDTLHYLKQHKIDVVPVFATDVAACAKARSLIWPLLACDYARVLHRITYRNWTESLLVTASGKIEYLTGAALFLLNCSKHSRLLVQMYNWAIREQTSRTPRVIRCYRHITENLVAKAMDYGKLTIAGQSGGIAAHLSTLFGRPIPTLPFVIDWSVFPSNSEAGKPHLQMGFLGLCELTRD